MAVKINKRLALALQTRVRTSGGFTAQLAENAAAAVFHTAADGGYGVALPGHELRLKLGAYTGEGLAHVIMGFVEANAGALARQGVHLGAWVDGDYLYLDLSEVVQYESLAAKLTHERGELAYWDFAQSRAVKATEYDWRTLAGL